MAYVSFYKLDYSDLRISEILGIKVLTYEEMRDYALKIWKEQPDCHYFRSESSDIGFTASRDPHGNVLCGQLFPDWKKNLTESFKHLIPHAEKHGLYLTLHKSSETNMWLSAFGKDESPLKLMHPSYNPADSIAWSFVYAFNEAGIR